MCSSSCCSPREFQFVAFQRFRGDAAGQYSCFFIRTRRSLVHRSCDSVVLFRGADIITSKISILLQARLAMQVNISHQWLVAVSLIIAGLFVKAIASRCAPHHDLGRGDLLLFVLLRAVTQMVFEGLGPYPVRSTPAIAWVTAQHGFLFDLVPLIIAVLLGVSLNGCISTIGTMAVMIRLSARLPRHLAVYLLDADAVMAIFPQLFFGWESLGVVSYLLNLCFWYKRPTSLFCSPQAFLVNSVGDCGFPFAASPRAALHTGSLDYATVFSRMPPNRCRANSHHRHTAWSGHHVPPASVCSSWPWAVAQVPVAYLLPYSMGGPDAHSALIQAATMVTAGLFWWPVVTSCSSCRRRLSCVLII